VATPALSVTLYQNYPNPFNPSTLMRYYLPEKSRVALEIYDISGKRVAQLVRKVEEKGFYVIEWNGKDDRGNTVVSGVYFCRLTAGKERISKKLVLLR
jgi:flagellar hook assembly protein FlgD